MMEEVKDSWQINMAVLNSIPDSGNGETVELEDVKEKEYQANHQ